MEKKLYVLTCNTLPLVYKGVQAGHAVAQYLLDNKSSTEWNNGTLVYLQVDNIESWASKLERLGILFSRFNEPDIGNKLTAISVLSDGKIFKKLKLMGS